MTSYLSAMQVAQVKQFLDYSSMAGVHPLGVAHIF